MKMAFASNDEQINEHNRIESPTIGEMVNKQTPFGIVCMLRASAAAIRAPGPYPTVRNVKPIDCDKLYEFMNALADKIECWWGQRKGESK
jgi:hypothetical protein